MFMIKKCLASSLANLANCRSSASVVTGATVTTGNRNNENIIVNNGRFAIRP